jgi:hypothetical protein
MLRARNSADDSPRPAPDPHRVRALAEIIAEHHNTRARSRDIVRTRISISARLIIIRRQ